MWSAVTPVAIKAAYMRAMSTEKSVRSPAEGAMSTAQRLGMGGPGAPGGKVSTVPRRRELLALNGSTTTKPKRFPRGSEEAYVGLSKPRFLMLLELAG